MAKEPIEKPQIRPLEAFHVNDGSDRVGLRDRTRFSESALSMSAAALQVVELMDGSNTRLDIAREFEASFGRRVSPEAIDAIIGKLEGAYFLEGPVFEAEYLRRLEAYRRQPARLMPHADALGIDVQKGEPFTGMLEEAACVSLPGPVVGLIAPHLDYPRGRPCYAAAYATLRGRSVPDRVVVLGTNHFGHASSVVATGLGFASPLGTTPADVAFLERLEQRCGDLRRYELDHQAEHSIEAQVAWLQHLFGAESFPVVAVLCSDPCAPVETDGREDAGVDLWTFAHALGDLIAQDDSDTLIVAGADLSHVGAAFGDDRPLDADFLEEVRQRDGAAIRAIEAESPGLFLDRVAFGGNPTRICSAGCIFALRTALPKAKATHLHYHQAVDGATQTGVTCTAIAFT